MSPIADKLLDSSHQTDTQTRIETCAGYAHSLSGGNESHLSIQLSVGTCSEVHITCSLLWLLCVVRVVSNRRVCICYADASPQLALRTTIHSW